MKTCSKCKVFKLSSEFHKHRSKPDGLQAYCKICCLKSVKKYSKTEKGKDVQRRANKKYQKKPKAKVAHKRYRQSEKGKAFYRKRSHRYRIEHPKRINACKAVNEAIRIGKLPRLDNLQCACGNKAEHYHHHKGYAEEHWLDVVPACRICHSKCHRKIA